MSKKVFISYRRSDTAAAAGRLYDRFCRLLGRKNVFLDIGAIEAAENFEEKIQHEIGKASAVLIMIGKNWMVAAPGDNKPRLLDPNDHVRAEVKAALAGKGLVMPVLVDNAAMPGAGLLPEDIRGIAALNAPPLRYESFDADVDRIARKVLGVGASEMLWDSAPLSRRFWSAIAGGLLAELALFVFAVAHMAILHRPIFAFEAVAQTQALIGGVLIAGLIAGLIYGSRRRPL
jgi:hypothetical protein